MSKREQGEAKLLEAQNFEAAGEMMKAVECYKSAFKLCPELEDELRPGDNEDEDGGEMRYTRMPNSSGTGGPRFQTFPACDLDNLEKASEMKRYFEEEGYIVLDGVMSPEEVRVAEGHFENFMRCVGVDVKDKEELSARFADATVGIVGKSGAGHSAMNWYVRSRSKVQQGFALTLLDEEVYQSKVGPQQRESAAPVVTAGGGGDGSESESKTEAGDKHKLIVSFDGFNYFRNPETDPSWQSGTSSWLHYDAGHKDHHRYIQGLVNLIDCTDENDAGLVVFPRSHKTCFPINVPQEPQYPSFMTYMGNVEWQRVREAKVAERPFRVPLKAGSLVMWRSSVMHCNSGCLPRAEDKKDPTQMIRRLAVYVCMCQDPRNPELTEQRRRYFNEGRTTCHQPDVLRGTGDRARTDFVDKGAIIISEDKLPTGASCLL